MPSSKVKPKRDRKKGRPGDASRRRYCRFCKDKIAEVDYKDLTALRHCLSDRGKIKSRRVTGTCRRHQRQVAVAVKRAREMALLPYTTAGRDVGKEGGRGSRR
jgi:small subunit ribosomal protein S18